RRLNQTSGTSARWRSGGFQVNVSGGEAGGPAAVAAGVAAAMGAGSGALSTTAGRLLGPATGPLESAAGGTGTPEVRACVQLSASGPHVCGEGCQLERKGIHPSGSASARVGGGADAGSGVPGPAVSMTT